MLINVDAKHLDWTTAVWLAQDEVGMEEIRNGIDLHTDNQRAFGLPSRLIAKIFLFRIIFGGTAYSFSKDSDFSSCKLSVKGWESVIDKFYRKYTGIKQWHDRLIKQATTTGYLSIPTGRSWKFEMQRNYKGELEWPITQIKNYPVQGLEADMMSLTRVSLARRLKPYDDVLLINSVHDSILVDAPESSTEMVVGIIRSVFKDVPANFRKLFGVDFVLPFRGEISVGTDWLNMETLDVECG